MGAVQGLEAMSESERRQAAFDNVFPTLERFTDEKIALRKRLLELLEQFEKAGISSDRLSRPGISLPSSLEVLKELMELEKQKIGLVLSPVSWIRSSGK
jgi:hypothetical protein